MKAAHHLNLRTREDLRAKIEATVGALQARATELTAEILAAEVEADAHELALRGLAVGLCAGHGEALGVHVFNDLTGRADVPDAEVARVLGVSRNTVSRAVQRARRNLGLPLRYPDKARPRAHARP